MQEVVFGYRGVDQGMRTPLIKVVEVSLSLDYGWRDLGVGRH